MHRIVDMIGTFLAMPDKEQKGWMILIAVILAISTTIIWVKLTAERCKNCNAKGQDCDGYCGNCNGYTAGGFPGQHPNEIEKLQRELAQQK